MQPTDAVTEPTFTALVPTRQSGLYTNFGVDIFRNQFEGHTGHAQWIALGAFPEDGHIRRAVERAHIPWVIDWANRTGFSEYDAYPARPRSRG